MLEVFFDPTKGAIFGFVVLKLVKSVLPIQRYTSKKRDTLYVTKLFRFLPGPAVERPVGIVEFKLVLLVEIQRSKYSQKILNWYWAPSSLVSLALELSSAAAGIGSDPFQIENWTPAVLVRVQNLEYLHRRRRGSGG